MINKGKLFNFSDETLGVTLTKQDSCLSQFTSNSSADGESVRVSLDLKVR